MKGKYWIGNLIVKATEKTAVASVSKASHWYVYQPKEPEALRKYVERNKK